MTRIYWLACLFLRSPLINTFISPLQSCRSFMSDCLPAPSHSCPTRDCQFRIRHSEGAHRTAIPSTCCPHSPKSLLLTLSYPRTVWGSSMAEPLRAWVLPLPPSTPWAFTKSSMYQSTSAAHWPLPPTDSSLLAFPPILMSHT